MWEKGGTGSWESHARSRRKLEWQNRNVDATSVAPKINKGKEKTKQSTAERAACAADARDEDTLFIRTGFAAVEKTMCERQRINDEVDVCTRDKGGRKGGCREESRGGSRAVLHTNRVAVV